MENVDLNKLMDEENADQVQLRLYNEEMDKMEGQEESSATPKKLHGHGRPRGSTTSRGKGRGRGKSNTTKSTKDIGRYVT